MSVQGLYTDKKEDEIKHAAFLHAHACTSEACFTEYIMNTKLGINKT